MQKDSYDLQRIEFEIKKASIMSNNYIENFCAYHPNQLLTNFCTCTECLLPVCPSCIKIHSQQHHQKNSSPSFQKLNDVFSQVSISFSNIISNLDKLRGQLLEVQKVKKQNQSLIRQKIKVYRNKLIRQFERAIFDLQYTIIKKFEDQDEKFIQQIEDIDKSIDRLYISIQSQQSDLQSQDGLRTIIFHLSKNIEIQSLQFVSSIDKKIKQMLKKNLYLEIQEHKIDQVKNSVLDFLKLELIEWGTNYKEQGMFRSGNNIMKEKSNHHHHHQPIQKTNRTHVYNYHQAISNQQTATFRPRAGN